MFHPRLYSDFNWGLATQEKKKERKKKKEGKGKKVTCYHPRAETPFVCVPKISGGLAAWRLILTHKQINE